MSHHRWAPASLLALLCFFGHAERRGHPSSFPFDLVPRPAAAQATLGDPDLGPRLQRALARYREIATRGGWPSLSEALVLEKGQTGPQVALLKQRLTITGDLSRGSFIARIFNKPLSPAYDDATEAAVRRFQKRHGLEPDGRVGPDTVRALNVPVEARIRRLQANLERLRLFGGDPHAPRSIWVNIPEYRLSAFERGREVLRMRVVIGTEYDRTPIFSDQMTYVVFRPEWNIPKSIAIEELLPQIQEDPEILERKFLEVVERFGDEPQVVDPETVDWYEFEESGYDLRQKPGPWNPLGNVKFMLPNRFNVYLHDTPADSLFTAEDPAFSHGCIRVEKPVELAQFVLRQLPEWDLKRILAAMADISTRTVTLPEPIPVHVVYLNAWVASDGSLNFREDVYDLDRASGNGSQVLQ